MKKDYKEEPYMNETIQCVIICVTERLGALVRRYIVFCLKCLETPVFSKAIHKS